MNLENPRLSYDAMELACMLIKNFDRIERQDPRQERFQLLFPPLPSSPLLSSPLLPTILLMKCS